MGNDDTVFLFVLLRVIVVVMISLQNSPDCLVILTCVRWNFLGHFIKSRYYSPFVKKGKNTKKGLFRKIVLL